MANIAYVRVSTKEQNTGRQLEALKSHKIAKIFEEKVSGKDTNRVELQKMLEYVREDDVVIVESFSRLSRNMLDLLTIVAKLKEKNVGFISLKENIDTTTSQGRFQLNVFGAMYEFERENIKEKQREGIDLALAEGRAYGRPKTRKVTGEFIAAYDQWKSGTISATKAIEVTGMSRAGFYSVVKEHEATM